MWLIGANLGYIIRIGRKYRDAYALVHERERVHDVPIVSDLVSSLPRSRTYVT